MGQFSGRGNYHKQTVEVVDATLKRSTAKAGFYMINGVGIWIPFSHLRKHPETGEDSVDRDNSTGSLFLPRWLAEERDLEYEECGEDE